MTRKKRVLKPSKVKLLFLLLSGSFAILNFVTLGIGLYLLNALQSTLLFMPAYFYDLCLATAVVDGVWVLLSVAYFLYNRI